MNDWTAGYVADIGYTFGYYHELNPLAARLAFLNAGLVPPQSEVHCELGFGQGLSVNLHAAGAGSVWYATDFNPAQARFAQSLAGASGAPARLYDQAFADFCQRTDLPDFDSIGLHGIWSWISDDNRAVIVDFIRRKLKVGGVLYISYNTQPGWAAMVPFRDLLTEHAEVMAAPGRGIVSRIDAALEFADKLMAADPAFARANPQVSERLKKLKGQDRNYLAHEYFNRDWLPMPFSRLAEWLVPTKLDYACSASYLDHLDPINLTTEQQALLEDTPDPMFRQTVRDFCTNTQFRKDYWVKGACRLSPLEQAEALRSVRVMLIQPRAEVSLEVAGNRGICRMSEDVYAPILDFLADHQPHTLAEIEAAIVPRTRLPQVVEAALLLCGTGALAVVQDERAIQSAIPFARQLNAFIMDKARGSGDIAYLASPVTGGGIAVSRIQQQFLLARMGGARQPAEWAAFAWKMLATHGRRLIKEGRPLDTAEDNLAELTIQAQAFAELRLPILQALLVA